MKTRTLHFLALPLLSACAVSWPEDDWTDEVSFGPTTSLEDGQDDTNGGAAGGARSKCQAFADAPSACGIETTAVNSACEGYVAMEDSLHELVTCAGAQIQIASGLVSQILVSNTALFTYPEDAELIQSYFPSPVEGFMRDGAGGWVMSLNAGSKFTVRFYAPAAGDAKDAEPILADPFDIESYLVGTTITSEYTLDEMWEDPDLMNTFYWTWETPGPLIGLLNGGEPVPQAFEVTASLFDLASLIGFGEAKTLDVGPLESLVEVLIDSDVRVRDSRADWRYSYTAAATRATIGEIMRIGKVQFSVSDLRASNRAFELTGEAADVRSSSRQLSGRIEYFIAQVDSPSEGSGDTFVPILDIFSDFGDGSSYPEVEWACPL